MRAFLVFGSLIGAGLGLGHLLYPEMSPMELLMGAAVLAGFSMVGVLRR